MAQWHVGAGHCTALSLAFFSLFWCNVIFFHDIEYVWVPLKTGLTLYSLFTNFSKVPQWKASKAQALRLHEVYQFSIHKLFDRIADRKSMILVTE